LITALARHELTDVIQARIDIAIPRGSRAPTLRSPVDIHVFAAETFDLGREEIDAGHSLALGLYSAERCRHREGADVAWDALRRWLRRRGSKRAVLLKMAAHFHGAERAVRHALEIVL
jgi:hypothetical protein